MVIRQETMVFEHPPCMAAGNSPSSIKRKKSHLNFNSYDGEKNTSQRKERFIKETSFPENTST